MGDSVKIVVPGDDPPQIAGSPALERLASRGEVVVYSDRPDSEHEKIARVSDAAVILNSRSAVTWRESDFAQLPALGLIATGLKMPVHPELQAAADANRHLAYELVVGAGDDDRRTSNLHRRSGRSFVDSAGGEITA